MMRFHRSALFAGLLAIGVAACGDDVQVVDPPPPAPPPLNVSVSPQNQNILVGQTADFTVNISGGVEGVQATWTCSTGNSNVASNATVTATGCRVTGAGAGSTTVTVVVTKGQQSAQAGGQVAVSEVPNEPATVSISSLNQGGNPAIITAIRGQLNVTMNVVRNDETPTQLKLWLGGVQVASQTFAPGAAAIEEVEGPDGEIVQQITLSFLTDRYGGMFPGEAVTGQAWHLNGLHLLQATLDVAERPGDPIASNSFELNLLNFNRVHISEVGTAAHQTKLPTNSALDSNGNIWYGGPNSGPVAFRAVPVIYQPQAGNPTQPRQIATSGGGAGLTVNLSGCTSATVVTAPYDYSFACATTQSNNVAPSIPGNQAMGADGNAITFGGSALLPFPNTVAPIVGPHPFPVRIDKVGPSGTLRIATQTALGNRENWVNAAYNFTTGLSGTSDGGVGCAATNCQPSFIVRAGSSAGAIVAQGITNPSTLDNSVNNSAYFLQAELRDRLGNLNVVGSTVAGGQNVNNPAASSHTLSTFGVDKEAPILFAGAGSIEAETVINLVAAEEIQVRATDVISGFSAPAVAEGMSHAFTRILGTPMSTTLTRQHIVGSGSISATPFATANAGSWVVQTPGAVNNYVQAFNSLQLDVPLSAVIAASPNGFGYYIYQARVRDKAGNVSENILTKQIYVSDESVPQFTGLVAQGVFTGGQPATFPGSAQDQVEVHQGSFAVQYPGLGRLLYDRPSPLVDPLFDDNIALPAPVNFTTDFFVRSLSLVTADAAPTPPLEERGGHAPGAAGPIKPDQVEARVYNGLLAGLSAANQPHHLTDWANADAGIGDASTGSSGFLRAGILAFSVADGRDFASTTDFPGGTIVEQHYIRPEYTLVAGPGAGNATATFTVRTVGAAPNFVNPFAAMAVVERGDIFGIGDPDLGQYMRLIGTATEQFTAPFPTGTIGNNQLRYYEWTFSVTRPTTAVIDFHAVGITAEGDGLASRFYQVDFGAGAGTHTGDYN